MIALYGSNQFLLGTPGNISYGSPTLLDAAGDRMAAVLIAPKAGTIDRLACWCTAVAGTVPSYDFRLEGVSAAAPTGSLIGTNTSGSFTPAASTLHVITMTASHVVAAGDPVAILLNSASATGANNATFQTRNSSNDNPIATFGSRFPQTLTDLSVGTWTEQSGLAVMSPVYTDGSYFPFVIPRVTAGTHDFNSGSTPDERGIRWTQPITGMCHGAAIYVRNIVASSDFKIQLYNTSSDTVSPIVSKTYSYATYARSTSNAQILYIYWTPVALAAGSDYRLTFVPTTTNNIRVASNVAPNEDIRKAWSQYYSTTRTRTLDGDAGSWTDDVTSFTTIVPLFNEISPNTLVFPRSRSTLRHM